MDKLQEKLNIFFQSLAESEKDADFDPALWLKKGTAAFEFAKTQLSRDEQERLKEMAYASILLEA